jgi:hypothetical protein
MYVRVGLGVCFACGKDAERRLLAPHLQQEPSPPFVRQPRVSAFTIELNECLNELQRVERVGSGDEGRWVVRRRTAFVTAQPTPCPQTHRRSHTQSLCPQTHWHTHTPHTQPLSGDVLSEQVPPRQVLHPQTLTHTAHLSADAH